ncbi:Hypothetical protein CINCED_3A009538 [Cinara cedri]|uniref:Uncharacterized protein n=1 Tax=Cinara cedri TaxID=506608 RepID=A0A5E4M013_9HEMI|nr:Hypothetical protein CINCED_3A009538 [Cinara cedri]
MENIWTVVKCAAALQDSEIFKRRKKDDIIQRLYTQPIIQCSSSNLRLKWAGHVYVHNEGTKFIETATCTTMRIAFSTTSLFRNVRFVNQDRTCHRASQRPPAR